MVADNSKMFYKKCIESLQGFPPGNFKRGRTGFLMPSGMRPFCEKSTRKGKACWQYNIKVSISFQYLITQMMFLHADPS